MPKVMLINVTHSEESRVGIMSEGVLESFEIESLSRAHLKGNIYKGIVHRIHPALEAAFVDIGAERDAFLPLDEICFKNLDEEPKSNGRANGGPGGKRQLRIRDVLRPGQQILVQITKEQFANKPPTISTFYSLPGRHLVLLPGSDDTGISRRIEGEERDRLRKAVDELKREEGFGLIVRTVAGLEENGDDLTRDLDYLKRLWANVQSAAKSQQAPSLVYREHDIVQRAIRDFYTPDISEIYIDDEDVFQRARDFLRAIIPGSESVLRLYRGEQPLFSAFHVEEQIESVFGRRVPLRSGGSIVIDGTEALTAIDVNSGGAVRGANPEETAFRTNREAAGEVARQLRLRDIGGIIVVDFIDMRDPQHIREIEQLMRDEMRLDKARHETSRISSLGLMQISRQRLRPAAAASSHVTCP
ncbi:MAG TPA: Rne/Rng family ribonuclease, partial [Chromatiales bacterium]|nr:Rne/Rng family ribonuclease [Chromatiales bacterium]